MKFLVFALAASDTSAATTQRGLAASSLRDSLECLSKSSRVLFGHEHTNIGGVAPLAGGVPQGPSKLDFGWADCLATGGGGKSGWLGCIDGNGQLSDVKDATGSYPGLFGFDFEQAVSFVNWPPPRGDPPHEVKKPRWDLHLPFIDVAHTAGALVTIDFHATNPISLKDATCGSPSHCTGDEIRSIVNGTANEMWRTWLDGLAALVKHYPQNAFIFRPFHEFSLTGASQWWWAKGNGVTAADFKAAWMYTRQYLESKGVDNLLWAYAPAQPKFFPAAFSEGEGSWYPGDDQVDVVCFDEYGPDDFSDMLLENCGIVVDFASKHNKIPAICETGVKKGVQNTKLADWFTERFLNPIVKDAKCSQIAYALTWAEGPMMQPPNHTIPTGEHWIPQPNDSMHQDFLEFYVSEHTVFAGELGECAPVGTTLV